MSAGLYIHVPFCMSKCPYCDFYSLRYNGDSALKYAESVIDEIETNVRGAEYTEDFDFKFDTVYFGGGTPSVLGADIIGKILDSARKNYNIDKNSEITVECNPSTVDSEFFKKLNSYGVNRVSLGMQSSSDTERRKLGRLADSNKVRQAVSEAQRAGIENISLDIMIGIPSQSEKTLLESAKFCIDSGVKHVSAYMLKVEPGTHFAKMGDKLVLPGEDEVCDMYLSLCGYLEENGIKQYEISNFSYKSYESRHNLKYWLDENYLGIGPAAHSFINNSRFYYERDIDSFIKGKKALFESNGGDFNEFVMLRLRLSDGLKEADVKKYFGFEIPVDMRRKCSEFEKAGLLISDESGIRLTKSGFLLSNYIIASLTDT